jgi:hypothetical protein
MRPHLLPPALLLAALSLPVHAQDTIPIDGTYAVGVLWGYASSDCAGPSSVTLIGAEEGTLVFQAAGTYTEQFLGTEVCETGFVSGTSDSESGTYVLDPSGKLTLDPGTPDPIELVVSTDMQLAVAAGSLLTEGPLFATAVRLGSGHSAASLNGRYHFAELGMRNDGSGLFSWIESGVLTFDGVGAYAGTSTRKTLDDTGLFVVAAATPTGIYSVVDDGSLMLGPGPHPGAVASDGGFFFAVDRGGQSLRLLLGLRESVAADYETAGGDWGMGTFALETGVDVELPEFRSDWLDIVVHADLGATTSSGTEVWSNPLGLGIEPVTGSGTYTVAPDGSLLSFVEGRPPGVPGAVDEGGRVAFLANTLMSPDVTLALMLHVGPGPILFGAPTPGAGGVSPSLSTAGGFAHLGNTSFGFKVADGVGAATGLLGISLGHLAPLGLPALGGTLWLDPFGLILQPSLALSGTAGTPGVGSTTAPVPLPADPVLDGLEVFAQAFLLDLAAVGGVAMTPALQVTLTR